LTRFRQSSRPATIKHQLFESCCGALLMKFSDWSAAHAQRTSQPGNNRVHRVFRLEHALAAHITSARVRSAEPSGVARLALLRHSCIVQSKAGRAAGSCEVARVDCRSWKVLRQAQRLLRWGSYQETGQGGAALSSRRSCRHRCSHRRCGRRRTAAGVRGRPERGRRWALTPRRP